MILKLTRVGVIVDDCFDDEVGCGWCKAHVGSWVVTILGLNNVIVWATPSRKA